MEYKEALFYFDCYKKLEKTYGNYLLTAFAEYRLSPNEIEVVSGIKQGLYTASSIAKSVDVSKALVSRSVKSLNQNGYILVTLSQTDKREQYLSLTDDGEKIANIIDEANQKFFNTAFLGFEQTERAVLSGLLDLMMINLRVDNERY